MRIQEIEAAYQQGVITAAERYSLMLEEIGDIPDDVIPELREAAEAEDLDFVVMSWCGPDDGSYERECSTKLERYRRGQARLRALRRQG